MASVAAPVSVRVAPLHNDVPDGVADTPVGAVLIVMATDDTVLVPQALVADNV